MCCPWRWAAPATWPLGVGASPPRTRPTRSTSGAFPTRARPGRSRARTSLWGACATCRSTPSCRTWPTAACTGTSTSTPAPPSKGASRRLSLGGNSAQVCVSENGSFRLAVGQL
uniref:Putative secreted protein n=1 Tax=Ixodes ricinus TaxID=34613 RepID=A0A6B0UKH6_IXORI